MVNIYDRSSDGTKIPLESDTLNPHALISGRAILAGLLVAFFTLVSLLSLGLAVGGISMDSDTSAKGAGIFTGVWFLVSSLVSLFVGSYFAARVSKYRTGRIGSAQGLVIAALFVGFFIYQAGNLIGSAGQAVGGLVKGSASMVAGGVEKASESPAISNAVSNLAEDALGGLNLRSDIRTVATGVATRIASGDTESAKNYLAFQSGISPAEADVKIAYMKARFDQTMIQAREGAATAMKSAGWTLFLLTVLGAVASIGGGALGSVANFRRPLIREEGISIRRPHTAV